MSLRFCLFTAAPVGLASLGACGGAPAVETGKVVTSATGIELVQVAAGSFSMGSSPSEEWRNDDELQHEVTLTHGFLLGRYEVTREQWLAVMGEHPSESIDCGPGCPANKISWFAAAAFANALSAKEGLETCYSIDGEAVTWPKGHACMGYRLPTEAEWEYAARAGSASLYPGSDHIKGVAWYGQNSGDRPHPVGKLAPNAWGFHDMAGNLEEWCWDVYGDYGSAAAIDPVGVGKGPLRVSRGSDYTHSLPHAAKVPRRDWHQPRQWSPALGFRIGRSL
jgi:formylglycine-generating enzyme required for sulfatase activity